MLPEWPTGQPGDEDAEQAERVVVPPTLSWLEGERELGQSSEPLLGAQARGFRTGFGAVVGHRLLQRRAVKRHPIAGAVGQQVAKGDGTAGGDGVVERRCGVGKHAAIRELR